MIIIASAAFCSQDITVEIGDLPPAFLPIGNKRLFELQAEILQKFDEEIWLSLPSSYKISEFDQDKLDELGIKIIFVPEDYTLSESLAYCIDKTGASSNLRLLMGDTLFGELPQGTFDFIAVAEAADDYKWGMLDEETQSNEKIITGYFYFSNVKIIQQSLCENPTNFVEALKNFCNKQKVTFAELQNWSDFGHRNLYFKQKVKSLLPRSFNELMAFDNYLIKSSSNIEKIRAEFDWFDKLPSHLTLHVPRVVSKLEIKDNRALYGIEIIPSFTLGELLVFGENSSRFWQKIFYQLKSILTKFQKEAEIIKPEIVNTTELNDIYSELYLSKTLTRIREYEGASGQTLSEYKSIAQDAATYIPKTSINYLAFSHGDMCFSNILYNSHNERLYLIDPKGSASLQHYTSVSDIRYDIAKIFHSLIGGYDHIIARKFSIEGKDLRFSVTASEKMEFLRSKFIDLIVPDDLSISLKEILAINVLLFISMVPLHDDSKERQEAFLMNAKRLYKILKKEA